MRFAVLAALPFLAAASAFAASPDDEAINAVYTALAAAKAANDPAAIASAFAPEATLITPMPAPAGTGSGLAAAIAPMAERLRTDRVRIATDYRIERRTRFGDVAVDAGYMRTRFTAPEGAPKPMDMVNRFLVTLKKQADGRWAIVGDASLPARAEAWDKLAPQPGLKFDR